jgi:hypothetical protein
MTSNEFRVESSHQISARLLPVSDSQQYDFGDRALAVAEMRVVHVPTGEVVLRKTSRRSEPDLNDEL